MPHVDWTIDFQPAITVCDRDGIVLEMNDLSAEAFKADGGGH